MIAQNTYRCSNDSSPSHATQVCVQPNCQHPALMCGGANCSCEQHHLGHMMVHIKWLLNKAPLPQELPEHLASIEKGIDSLIDGFIKQLEELRRQHREYIRQFLLTRSGGSVLRRRLAGGECLDQATSTGDCFSKLVQEINQGSDVESPYKLSAGEIEQRTAAVGKEMAQVQERVRQLWSYAPPKFSFSSNLKHKRVTLSENNTRAVDSGSWSDVLLEPAVPMTATSKLSFKVNKLSSLMVGVCYRNVVQQKGYSVYGTNTSICSPNR